MQSAVSTVQTRPDPWATEASARGRVSGITGVSARFRRIEEHPPARVVQHEVVQDEQSGHAHQGLVHEVVGGPVPHLVHGEVVGLRGLPRRELRMMMHAHPRRHAITLGGGLVVEDVDRVARSQQRQHVDRVVGDAGGRGWDGREEGEALHRRAISTYSCGP